jgi:poly [ADP-ribose] polymerase
MATQLKVEELRTQLAQRGLTTTGTKPTLVQPSFSHIYKIVFSLFEVSTHCFLYQVRRLQNALRKESKQSTGTDDGFSANKKRNRDSENEASNSTKIMAVEKFREMSIQQLRQLATLQGISKSGSKKDLIERLCEDSNHDSPQGIENSKSLSIFLCAVFGCCDNVRNNKTVCAVIIPLGLLAMSD